MMKSSMRELGPQFASHRMLMEYTDQFYVPALENARRISEHGYKGSKTLAAYLAKLNASWSDIAVVTTPSIPDRPLKVGETLELTAEVKLGKLSADEVSVEVYHGPMTTTGEIGSPSVAAMKHVGAGADGAERYVAEIDLGYAGRQGLAVRVLPHHEQLVQRLVPGYVVWG